jgi:hypothetical protein
VTDFRCHLQRVWRRGNRLPLPDVDVAHWAAGQTVHALYESGVLVLLLWLYRGHAPIFAVGAFAAIRSIEAGAIFCGRDPQTAHLGTTDRILIAASCYVPMVAVMVAFAIVAPLIGAPTF